MSALAIKILVVDDEPPIRRLLRTGLGTQGYVVLEAGTGRAALDALAEKPDLMILDLGLPDMQGHEVLRILRERDDAIPVVILSSRDDESGKVKAFDLGADDYVTKPFGMNELLARVRAALRHRLQVQGEKPVFVVDGLSVDLVRRIVRVEGGEVKLSPKEYELLRLLVQHAGKVLSHAFLLKEVWGPTTDPQYLRVYVRQIRQKIETSPERPSYILTETGVGYRLRAPNEVCMDLAELIEPSRCLVDLRYADKAACLGDLAKRAAAAVGLEPAPILEALRAREALGSTGLGNGIAVPHARLASVASPFVLVARLREPIAFEAVDDKPVDIVCLALLPAAASGAQLPVLACIARRLREGPALAAARRARDANGVFAALTAGA